jgi:hypothetical protein
MTTAPWVYTGPGSNGTLMVCPGSRPGPAEALAATAS